MRSDPSVGGSRFGLETYLAIGRRANNYASSHLVCRLSLTIPFYIPVALCSPSEKIVPLLSSRIHKFIYLFSNRAWISTFTYPAAEGIWVSPHGASLWTSPPFPQLSNRKKDSNLTLSLMISALWASSASCTFSSQFFVSAAIFSSQNVYF